MDIRVEQALDLMNKSDFLSFLRRSGLGQRCFYFFRFMKIELLPSLWLHARPLFSAQLVSLIQDKHAIFFADAICPYFDFIGEDQLCRRFGYNLRTLCVAPHIYPCFWRSGGFDWVVKQGLRLSSQLYWSEEEFLWGFCDYIVQENKFIL